MHDVFSFTRLVDLERPHVVVDLHPRLFVDDRTNIEPALQAMSWQVVRKISIL
jgi:hypothetical protein